MIVIEQAAITRTLHKFLIDHDHYNISCIDIIHDCMKALEKSNVTKALEIYEKFMRDCGLGRMGAFDDVGVKVKFEHENKEYVDVVYRSLLSNWSRAMSRLSTNTDKTNS